MRRWIHFSAHWNEYLLSSRFELRKAGNYRFFESSLFFFNSTDFVFCFPNTLYIYSFIYKSYDEIKHQKKKEKTVSSNTKKSALSITTKKQKSAYMIDFVLKNNCCVVECISVLTEMNISTQAGWKSGKLQSFRI